MATIAVFAALGGGALAATTFIGSDGRIHGCVSKQGKLTVVKPSKKCKRGQTAIAWNQRGKAGVAGAKGEPGAPGAGGAAGAKGETGETGDPGIGLGAFFGSGEDGDQTMSANTTLGRDMYYRNLTIASGVVLHAGGFRVLVSGTLTLGDGSRISDDAQFGSGAAPGTLGGGADPGDNAGNSLGGLGGGGATVATPPSAAAGGRQVLSSATAAITGRTLDGVRVTGGSGGSNIGFSGGGGGGVVVVAARSVSPPAGTASITANGGDGTGSDGGGGGGVVVIISTSSQPSALTLSVHGGGSEFGSSGGAGTAIWLN